MQFRPWDCCYTPPKESGRVTLHSCLLRAHHTRHVGGLKVYSVYRHRYYCRTSIFLESLLSPLLSFSEKKPGELRVLNPIDQLYSRIWLTRS